ncbi:MAG TPA: murein transglycosylase A [Rhizomicrobium sp.]
MAQKTRRTAPVFLFVVIAVFAAAAVWFWWTRQQQVTAALRLTPVSFDALPGWRDGDPRAALAAFVRSCSALVKQEPGIAMGGAGYAGTAGDWTPVCRTAQQTANSSAEARAFFESAFVPFAVNANSDPGLFTGYYEPELRVSARRHGPYQTPIYALPDDLITADLGQFKDSLAGERVTGRVEGHKLVPYPSRAAIDANGLPQARVLAWGDDPIAVFFLHIQGSGRALLEDGTAVRIAYAGQNGRPYTPVGRTLIHEGAMARSDLSMQGIRAWLLAHPGEAQRVMETDASYVFFDEKPLGDPALGATGSEGVPLMPGASLAVDRTVHPLGVPLWLALDAHATALPRDRLMVAQDTGGAIKGAVRGDVFFGFGSKAEWNAGHMKAAGAMFVLLPKALAARLPAGFTA